MASPAPASLKIINFGLCPTPENTVSDQTTTKTIETTVRFPLAQGDPYHQREPATTTVGDVLSAALAHFQVRVDPASQYYLAEQGQQLAANLELSEVAGQQDALNLTLVKVLIQG
jgi:hypothetical protein